MYKSTLLIAVTASLLLSACSNDPIAVNIPGVYRIDIDQGNIITQENINKLKPGLSKQQVLFALGSPSIQDVFHQDRWDYIYSVNPGDGELSQSRLTLFFNNDQLDSITGDYRPEVTDTSSTADKDILVDVPARPPQDMGFFETIGSWFDFSEDLEASN